MATDDQLGPLLRLWGISTAQLPSPSATPSELKPFLASILREAVPFTDSAAPKSDSSPGAAAASAWKDKGTRSYAESNAPVEVSERYIPASALGAVKADNKGPNHDGGGETWACRRSVHADAAEAGTASWGEFVRCFKEAHSVSEEAFTPDVVGRREAVTWACPGDMEVEIAGSGAGESSVWDRFQVGVYEMQHKMPGGLLHDRVFAVLTVSACLKGSDEFIVVSVRIHDLEGSEMGGLVKGKGVVVGAYSSVERIRKVDGGDIEWLMATTSDAKGILPMWVQTRAVVSVVAKDVQLFLSWIGKEREKADGERAEVLKGL